MLPKQWFSTANSFIYSVNKYLMSDYHGLGTMLGSMDKMVNLFHGASPSNG